MRYLLPIALLGIAEFGPAEASSFMMLDRSENAATPSILRYAEPRRGSVESAAPDVISLPPLALDAPLSELAGSERGDMVAISPSMVALGEPAVEAGDVASIGDGERSRQRDPRLPPMVIRGGISGDPFTFSEPARQTGAEPQQEAGSAPQSGMRPAAPPASSQSPMPAATPQPQRSGPAPAGSVERPW